MLFQSVCRKLKGKNSHADTIKIVGNMILIAKQIPV